MRQSINIPHQTKIWSASPFNNLRNKGDIVCNSNKPVYSIISYGVLHNINNLFKLKATKFIHIVYNDGPGEKFKVDNSLHTETDNNVGCYRWWLIALHAKDINKNKWSQKNKTLDSDSENHNLAGRFSDPWILWSLMWVQHSTCSL